MIDFGHRFFFLGIGGIGMSAIARYLHHEGKQVSGYDKTETALTKKLVSEGIDITYTDSSDHIPDDIDMVIYTPAIPQSNIMFQWCRNSGLEMIKRSKALGLISENRKTIAIAGTHGKTTTSAILSILLRELGVENTAFVGGIMSNVNSNFIYGEGDWVVVEADEYDRSFWQLHPDIAIILSMDDDHLDIYENSENVKEGFRKFTSNIKEGGSLFIHHSLVEKIDVMWSEMLKSKKIDVHTFGMNKGDVFATNARYVNGVQEFEVIDGDETHLMRINLLGEHNISNASGAVSIAKKLGYQYKDIITALSKFKGIHRRFEIVEKNEDVVLVDDYAHHPEELKVAIHAARNVFKGKRITGIFQPHLYSRTNDFYTEFAKELSELDDVILTDIYPAREEPISGVSSDLIFERLDVETKYLVKKDRVLDVLREIDVEVVMVLGAGDIDKEVKPIKKYLFENVKN